MTRVIGARASINGLSLAHSWYLLNKHGDLSLLMYFSKQTLVRIKASWKYCSITFFLGIHLKQEVWARRDKQVARGVMLGREKNALPVNNGERLLSFPISSLVTVPKQLILRWFCDLSASYREKKRRKQNTTHKVIDKKQNKIKKNKQTMRKQVTRVEFEDSKL